MSIGIAGFDHTIIAVRDMTLARRKHERLGFTIPPRGSHIEWGTGNWCIMFKRNYYELRGIVDPNRYTHGLEHFLEKREGQLGIAFRSDLNNHDLHRRAVDSGLYPAPPRELTRNFELEAGNVPVSFRLVFFDPTEAPALMASLVCEHLTPERLRKPEYLEHPNTAQDVTEIVSVVESLDSVTTQMSTLFGEECIRVSSGEVRAHLEDGAVLRIISQETAEHEGLSLEAELPYLASVAIGVADLSATTDVLRANEVKYTLAANRIRVAPVYACGTWLEFEQL